MSKVDMQGEFELGTEIVKIPPMVGLTDRYGIPPFSVWDTRQGYWQERKRAWLSLGIQSELGRASGLLWKGIDPMRDNLGKAYREKNKEQEQEKEKEQDHKQNQAKENENDNNSSNNETEYGTSIFDPVVCELVYKWFCPPGGKILDPFAGGAIRGIIAAYLGYQYTGIELRPEQVEANKEQAIKIGVAPRWVVGNGKDCELLAKDRYDLIFSCPPYYNLEVYSDLPGDLSNCKTYKQFLEGYNQVIVAATKMLAYNRFACFVVSDIRDDNGYYLNFTRHTIEMFEKIGAKLYNEAILLTAIGSLPLRMHKQFGLNRKLGKAHQNILIFYQGGTERIKANFPNLGI